MSAELHSYSDSELDALEAVGRRETVATLLDLGQTHLSDFSDQHP